MAIGLTPPGGTAPGLRRRLAWGALVLGVLAVHACVTQGVADRMADLGAEQAMPARIEVAYVREMALSAPPPMAAPAAAPPVAAPARPKRARPARPAASAPEPPAEAPAAEAAVAAASEPAAASAPPAAPEAASAPVVAEAPAEAASAPASAAGVAAFEWPASTRVSYGLTGYYRGDVEGSAQVEWARDGSHYQVHLDLLVGPSRAPILTRRMTSDGEITADGLAPRRYDQATSFLFNERRVTIAFEPGSVVLANGERRDSVPGVQDTASQFIQLIYVFSTRPERLRSGSTVDIPLALPHKVDVWTYDVAAEEVLDTPFGALPAIHLTPRRAAPKPGELSIEMWFAPQLRYLPVRILIRQDAQTYLDLMIAKRPELAAP